MKYLNDLYHVIWKDGKLIEPQPEPTEEEMKNAKEEALEKMLDFLPCMCYFGLFSNFSYCCYVIVQLLIFTSLKDK